MPPAPPTTAITDSKFNALKAKLRELFELDKSDLDFGIYRIIAAKNKEVTEFLDRQLKDVVKDTLAAHGAGAADLVQAELDKAIEQARALGADPETLPKVKDLRARLESAGGAAGGAADLEADIYNHFLAAVGDGVGIALVAARKSRSTGPTRTSTTSSPASGTRTIASRLGGAATRPSASSWSKRPRRSATTKSRTTPSDGTSSPSRTRSRWRRAC